MANKRMAKKAAKKAAEAKKVAETKAAEPVKAKEIEIQPIKKVEEPVVEAKEEIAEPVAEVKEEVVEVVAEEVKVEEAVENTVEEVKAEEAAPVEEVVVEKKPRAKRTTKKKIKTSLVVQAAGREVTVEEAVERATEDWCKSGNDKADLKEIAVYVKPEESAIFYVINGKATGRVSF